MPWVRASDRSKESELLASRLRAYLLISGFTWALHTIAYLSLGRLWIGFSNGAAAVLTVALGLFLRARRSSHRDLVLATHVLTGIVVFALTSSAYGTGQATSMPIWFLVVVPLSVGHALGRRAAIGWSGVVLASMAFLHAAAVLAPRAPEFVPSSPELLVAQGTLALLALALAVVSRDAADRQIAELAAREATIQKQAAELAVARDQALEGSRAKSIFLATMTHEIRTPLNGVLGMARLLERTVEDPLHKEQVETIRASGETLLALVNDVLDFSKIEAGKLELEPSVVSPMDVVEDAARVLAAAAAEKGIVLTTRAADDVPPAVEVDPKKWRQILVNLIGNAVKFTERGSVTVHLRRDGASGLAVAVTDTGIGIDEAQQARLFEPFLQVDGSAARAHEGTGLGLSISQRLARALGGDIAVSSSPGRGSTFTLTLHAPPRDASALVQRAPIPALPASLSILLVEDNAVNELVALRMLEHLGLRADVVRDGEAAIAASAATAYDVVLLDYRLPRLSGPDVARAIRARPPPQPRLVAMTANATAEDRATCAAAGMDSFLSKPVDLDALAAVLGTVRPTGRPMGRPMGSKVADPAPKDTASPLPIESMLGPRDIVDVLDHFLVQLDGAPTKLAQASAAGDAADVAKAAHTLRPNAKMFGAETLASHCAAIESLARLRDHDALQGAVREAITACGETRAALTTRRAAWLAQAEDDAFSPDVR